MTKFEVVLDSSIMTLAIDGYGLNNTSRGEHLRKTKVLGTNYPKEGALQLYKGE